MKKVVAGLVSRKRKDLVNEYLFIEYKKHPGLHGLCGGHTEEGENDESTLIREFSEELGINIKPIKNIHIMDADVKGEKISIWNCIINNYDFVIQDEEIVSVKWLSVEEILNNQKMFFPAIYKYFKENINVVS